MFTNLVHSDYSRESRKDAVVPAWLFEVVKFITGVATGWLAHVWRVNADRASRRRAFCDVLRTHMLRFNSADWKLFEGGELIRMHQESVAEIDLEYAKIWADIRPKFRLRFAAARSAYCNLERKDIEPYDLTDYPMNPKAILFPHYDRGQEKISAILAEMLHYAK